MSEPRYVSGADAMASWRDELLSGAPPTLYPVGVGAFDSVQIGPGLVTLLGGAPGAGKTALTMQFVFDALRLTQSLRVVVANVEMPPGELLNRQLARLSGVELSAIRHRKLTAEHGERIGDGLATLEQLAERLCFARGCFDLGNVAATADAFGTDLLVIDYIQRFRPPGKADDTRTAVNGLMGYLRQFADAGFAIIVVSAVGRAKDQLGRSSYDGNNLGLASFRESGELEYGADSAYLLCPNGNSDAVSLRCLKDRNGEPRDILLQFDRACQRFTPASASATPNRNRSRKGSAGPSPAWEWTGNAADGEEAF